MYRPYPPCAVQDCGHVMVMGAAGDVKDQSSSHQISFSGPDAVGQKIFCSCHCHFVHCVKPLISPAGREEEVGYLGVGVDTECPRVLAYLDDFLLCTRSRGVCGEGHLCAVKQALQLGLQYKLHKEHLVSHSEYGVFGSRN